MIKVLYPFQQTFLDYPDNISHAVLVYFLGCEHPCYACQNIYLKDLNYSKGVVSYDIYRTLAQDIEENLNKYRTNKIVLSGGDPLFKNNINFVRLFLHYANLSGWDVIVYTGYDIEYVKEKYIENFTYIKCGQYDLSKKQESKKTNDYIQFASKNQKLYNSKYELISDDGKYYFNKE